MGKNGTRGKGKTKPATSSAGAAGDDDDDALLDAAIAENKEVREAERAMQEAIEKVRAQGRVLTMAETLAKLDRVMLFTLMRITDDGSRDVCPSPSGEIVVRP